MDLDSHIWLRHLAAREDFLLSLLEAEFLLLLHHDGEFLVLSLYRLQLVPVYLTPALVLLVLQQPSEFLWE